MYVIIKNLHDMFECMNKIRIMIKLMSFSTKQKWKKNIFKCIINNYEYYIFYYYKKINNIIQINKNKYKYA